ncbi:hypothetical protein [Methanonatronarchaeum sp. AMET-Sl]|uniref:hypothetical protein n=1 Tax=Methanonatronarchaeum sp. AMET-Sl TaxID=3037654 RepID=UPI00244E3D7E|nr:hypothetical protein [Methanonatronarchaeum sp. AMET-Sl]WGI16878.1 hypothetical protein QEN48_05110 [Methanonatronarchaeum sp. AMET-Sl]
MCKRVPYRVIGPTCLVNKESTKPCHVSSGVGRLATPNPGISKTPARARVTNKCQTKTNSKIDRVFNNGD